MRKKLTVAIDEEVGDGLRAVIGPRKISRFIEELVRPHIVKKNMYAAYREMAAIRPGNLKPLSGPKARSTYRILKSSEMKTKRPVTSFVLLALLNLFYYLTCIKEF